MTYLLIILNSWLWRNRGGGSFDQWLEDNYNINISKTIWMILVCINLCVIYYLNTGNLSYFLFIAMMLVFPLGYGKWFFENDNTNLKYDAIIYMPFDFIWEKLLRLEIKPVDDVYDFFGFWYRGLINNLAICIAIGNWEFMYFAIAYPISYVIGAYVHRNNPHDRGCGTGEWIYGFLLALSLYIVL